MTLRTPRRRISPRAKRRYRAIREFFRRALGSSSQQDIKINSSIAVNVTDLKHKIVGIENQLNQVNRHCRDLVCLENNFRRDTQQLLSDNKNQEEKEDEDLEDEEDEEEDSSSSTTKTKSLKTQLLYKNSSSANHKSDESDYVVGPDNYQDPSVSQSRTMTPGCSNQQLPKVKSKRSKVDERPSSNDIDSHLRKHKAKSTLKNIQSKSEYSKEIFQSVSQPRHSSHNDSVGTHHNHKKSDRCREYNEYEKSDRNIEKNYKEVRKNKSDSTSKSKEKHMKSRKIKHSDPTLDDDFIADIIKRQYKPVKLFGPRASDVSQFSAPVCRDQEFSINEDIQEGTELCSCCYDGRQRSRYVRHHDLSDMRSICDTRLYSTQPKPRKHYHRRNIDNYNDSAYYDIVPVKEKSSPKSRRKFIEDNYIPYNNYYREVPPSPRTMRPRLNLKTQYYTEYDDYVSHGKKKRLVPVRSRSRRLHEYYEPYDDSDVTSEIALRRSHKSFTKHSKNTKIQTQPITPESGTLTSLRTPVYINENNNVLAGNVLDNSNNLNKTQDTDGSVDKTDKALCEIKDILQSFLQEIKKDSPTQCDKSEGDKLKNKQTSGADDNSKVNTDLGAGTNSFNNYNGNPQFMPPFANPCCYPMMPVCPLNCMQNPYVIPSPSYTCQNCSSNQKEAVCVECSKSKKDVTIGTSESKNNETDELIKEIYKFVAQSPLMKRHPNGDHEKNARKEEGRTEKVLTSRSVGGSSRTSRHDAKVGTPTMKCYSKSCEAIGSRMISDTNYYSTTTHSDTLLEKLSLEPSTQSDSDISTASTTAQKVKRSKFKKVMESLGFFKRKRRESSEEMETESSMEVKIKANHNHNRSPYRQHVANYMMHEQEYFRPPPMPGYGPRAEGPYGSVPPYERRNSCPCAVGGPCAMGGPPITELYLPHRVHQETIHEHAAAAHCRPPPPPASCPHMYPPHFDAPPHHPPHFDPPPHHPHFTPPQQAQYPTPPQTQYPTPPQTQYPPPRPQPAPPQQQPPVCLQEIEVKSTGTQSERKMSFFRKFSKKPSRAARVRSFIDPNRSDGTQTKSKEFCVQTKPPSKGFFASFKELQEKIDQDPMKFSLKTQNKLKDNDLKVRNAMLQKMFQKKNPFSPRNMLLKSFMGNNNGGNQSSFGQRPKLMYRPRFLF